MENANSYESPPAAAAPPSTSIQIAPGETVVIAEASREESARSTDLGGHSRSEARDERVLLVSVEVED